jgi:ABC-type nitrate/sulfonate/bicarbonate transport system permease component
MAQNVEDLNSSAAPAMLRLTLSRLRQANWPPWVIAIGLILWWQYGNSGHVSIVIAPPTVIAHEAHTLWASGELEEDIRVSGEEFLIGFLSGAIVGMLLGFAAGSLRRLARTIDPFINAIYAVPIIGLAPIFIVIFGIGVDAKVLIVAIAVFFPIYVSSANGVRATDAGYRELGAAFHLSRSAIGRKIVIPGAVPHIVSGVRVAVGHGLTAVLAAELFGAQAGIGLLVLNSSSSFNTAGVYVGIIIFAATGIILTSLVSLLERRVASWRYA